MCHAAQRAAPVPRGGENPPSVSSGDIGVCRRPRHPPERHLTTPSRTRHGGRRRGGLAGVAARRSRRCRLSDRRATKATTESQPPCDTDLRIGAWPSTATHLRCRSRHLRRGGGVAPRAVIRTGEQRARASMARTQTCSQRVNDVNTRRRGNRASRLFESWRAGYFPPLEKLRP